MQCVLKPSISKVVKCTKQQWITTAKKKKKKLVIKHPISKKAWNTETGTNNNLLASNPYFELTYQTEH